MLDLEPKGNGVLIPVRVHAGARRNAITGIHDGALRIAVAAAPEKGKANQAVTRLLCDALRLPKSALELASGATSTQKKFVASGLTLQQVQDRLAASLT